jgi:tetratricopeptide (TPR) repeat protein
MADLEHIRRRFNELVRARDFSGAAAFLSEAFREAKESGGREHALEIGDRLAGVLTAGGKDLEALDVYRELLTEFPEDVFLNLQVATFLTTFLRRPDEAIKTLAPVLDELLQDEHVRHATLGVWGTNQARLGNLDEARKSFELLREDDLSRMDPSAIHFPLVEELLSRGELEAECQEYLSRALGQAERMGDEDVVSRVRSLLNLL